MHTCRLQKCHCPRCLHSLIKADWPGHPKNMRGQMGQLQTESRWDGTGRQHQCYSSSQNRFTFSFSKVCAQSLQYKFLYSIWILSSYSFYSFFRNRFSTVSVSVFTSFQLQFFLSTLVTVTATHCRSLQDAQKQWLSAVWHQLAPEMD